jgi:hypothetical protein
MGAARSVHPGVVGGGIALALTLRALDKPGALSDRGERSWQLASEMGVSHQTINLDRAGSLQTVAAARARAGALVRDHGGGDVR